MARLIERGILCAAAALAAALVATDARACDLPPPESASIAAVLDGETLKLADGRIVKLIGAKAPVAPLGWRGEDPWPFVEEAKEALEALAANKAIELRFGGSRTDRHGYLLAQVFSVTGDRRLWLQEELVGKRLARVYSLPDNRAFTAELLAREKEARGKRLGLWSSPIASRTRATPSASGASFIPISSSREPCSTSAKAVAASISTSPGTGAATSHQHCAERRRRLCRRRARSAGARRQARARARLARLAERPMIEATHPDQIELLAEAGGAANDKPPQQRRAIAL